MGEIRRAGFELFVIALTLTTCSGKPEPAVSDLNWSVVKTQKRDGYRVSGTASVVIGNSGWYLPTVTLTDAKGCRRNLYFRETQDADSSASGKLRMTFANTLPLKAPVATADLVITYNASPIGRIDLSNITETTLVTQSKVVDPSVHVPTDLANPCGNETRSETRRQLREKAKTDPDGADAEAIAGMSRNEVFATAINIAGFLCAKVTDAYPSGGDIIVHCVEYRSGQGRVKYRVDTSSMQVTQL